jgi:glycosyltransferase involved in cell wall biosynthesis
MITVLPTVLLISPDQVAPDMAGPGIRYVELGRVLARTHDVRLAAPFGSAPVDDAPELMLYDPGCLGPLEQLVADAEVIVAPPLPPALIRCVETMKRAWIVDFYNAEPFEGLAHVRTAGLRERLLDVIRIDRIAYAARAGTAFVCASERQRDMWLGFLAANRRLESSRYRTDLELRRLIDVVPFGLPAQGPEPRGRGLRGDVFPPDAKIMVWNGGVWDWLDSDTVLDALVCLRERDPSWHLAFSGVGRPGHRDAMHASERLRRKLDRLGLATVGAVDTRAWTPYAERAAALLDADVGVSAHRASLEARFAHRARMLDLVWTGTPILCSTGDEWGEIVNAESLGEAVPPGDPEVFAAAASRIAERGRAAFAAAFEVAASKRTWDVAARPLITLVESVAGRRRRRPGLVGRGVALRHTVVFALSRRFGGLRPVSESTEDIDAARPHPRPL